MVLAVAAAPLAAQQRDSIPPRRAALEQQVRERIGRVVRERLRLTDEQMRQLQDVNQKYERQRLDLVRQEREARVALRRELVDDATANQATVSAQVDRMLKIQRQRLDLVEAEQRDLAKFLTPVQRAKYLALQNQMRERMEEMRQRQGAGRGAARGRPGGRPF